MLVGPPGDDLSKNFGLETVPNVYFTTAYRKAHWDRNLRLGGNTSAAGSGTVGAVILDSKGQIAAGNSTGGSQIGLVCSGAGDSIFRRLIATKIATYHSSGDSLSQATRRALHDMADTNDSCAVAAIDADGSVSVESTSALFYTASRSSDGSSAPAILHSTFPVRPAHVFYEDTYIKAGLSTYPSTWGHTTATLRLLAIDLFSLEQDAFTGVMLATGSLAQALQRFYDVSRCAFVTEGGSSLSLLPLHGLQKEWQPCLSDLKEFHEEFPGYVSSKDGPPMDQSRLNKLCSALQEASGVAKPFNYHFDGDSSDTNLFSRIVRGELKQWRIWEDDRHVAFLTLFANTPGFTVLVPRAHLPSDIFSLTPEAYTKLVCAARTVADILKRTFGVASCGMIFEGFEIDYAHAKLIPNHRPQGPAMHMSPSYMAQQTRFQEKYPGYITYLGGPKVRDHQILSSATKSLRELIEAPVLESPSCWSRPNYHMKSDALYHASIDFFKRRLQYKYCFVPSTTDSISSPMGLGSDSKPVPVPVLGQMTHLADSMQFALEYFLRIEDHLPGVYYINNFFRDEDQDSLHLNQFYHVECELRGDFRAAMSVAEKYIIHLTSCFQRDQEQQIRATAGGVNHLEALLHQYHTNGGHCPRITVEDAIKLPGMDRSMWDFVVPSDSNKGRTTTRKGQRMLLEHFHGAVWLMEMDHPSVPFYQAYTDETRAKARCADLLLGPGEVLGLGQRHVHAEDVQTALHQHQVPPESYQWYMDMRDVKAIMTTGWGMGVERFLAWVVQHHDIRDLTVIPRMKGYAFAP